MMIGMRNHAQISPPNTTHPKAMMAQRTIDISVSIRLELRYARYPETEPMVREMRERARKKGKTMLSGMSCTLHGRALAPAVR